MAQTIKLKRSAVSGNTPSTSDLELGEIAINTYDGKVFIKKDDGSASVIEVGAADNTKLPLAGGTMTGALNMGGNSISNVGSFTIDDVNFNGSSLTDAGNFTMDIGGDLTIDVDGADILLKDDGTEFGRFSRVTSDFVIKASASDQDLVFKGVDGASTITALTLDMSNEGTAKFNHDIELLDSSKAIFGTDNDLRIQHTGSHGYITNFTGHLVFSNESDDKQIQFKTDDGSGGSAVYVVVDGASENTKFFKNTRHNDSVRANFGTSDDLQIYHDTSDSYIKNNTGDLILDAANNIVLDADGGSISFKDGGVTKGQIQNSSDDLVIKVNTQDKDLKLQGNDGGSLITALTLDMSEGGNATFANNVTISGNLEVTGTTTQTGSIITNSNFTGLSDANSANATDFGFYGKYVESSTTKYAGMYYDASVDNTFKLFCDTQTAPTTTVNESATGYALANLQIASRWFNCK